MEYAYYQDVYRGQLGETDFLRLSRRAGAYLDLVTFGRITARLAETGAVLDAWCAVVDAMHLNEQGGGIASESNDGVTVNYMAGISTAKTENQRLYEAAALYLGHTGLLYRGV